MWHPHQLGSELPSSLSSADLPLRLRLDDRDVTLRWLAPDDTGRLIELFAASCEEAVQHHLPAAGVRMSTTEAGRLVSNDQQADAAVGLFEETGGETRLIGLGSFCRAADGQSAEASFVVHDQSRAGNAATLLLRALLGIAEERNLPQLVVHLHPEQTSVITALRGAGASVCASRDSALLESVLPVHELVRATKPHHAHTKESWMRDAAARTALKLERASEVLGNLPTP